jgi:ribosomal protein L28
MGMASNRPYARAIHLIAAGRAMIQLHRVLYHFVHKSMNTKFTFYCRSELYHLLPQIRGKLQHTARMWRPSPLRVKILEKNQKLHIQIVAVTLKVTSYRTMRKKKKVKKSEKPRFYGQNKLFFENPALQPLGSFNHMAACRSSLENTGKMSLILVFNKNSPRAHTESELGVLGVHGKLEKYVVHSFKRKN